MNDDSLIDTAIRGCCFVAAAAFVANLFDYIADKGNDAICSDTHGAVCNTSDPLIPLWVGIVAGVLAALLAVVGAVASYQSRQPSTQTSPSPATRPPAPAKQPKATPAAPSPESFPQQAGASSRSLAERFGEREFRNELVGVAGLALGLAQFVFS
jgi:hypothetical protein